jgi:hypothetical protein
MSSWRKRIVAGLSIAVVAMAGGIIAAPANAAPALFCTLRVDNPHGSVHATGTINVEAEVECPRVMGSITLKTELERVNPLFVWPAATKTSVGPKLTNNAATSCANGNANFRGWARVTLVAPAGYILTGSGTTAKYGNELGVSCGLARSASAEPEAVTYKIEFNLQKIT